MIKRAIKTVTVDFVQYDGKNYWELRDFCQGNLLIGEHDWRQGHTLFVYCLGERTCDVDAGDYVIRYFNGDLEVLTEKEFQETFKEDNGQN